VRVFRQEEEFGVKVVVTLLSAAVLALAACGGEE
jgi:hypothetical protein